MLFGSQNPDPISDQKCDLDSSNYRLCPFQFIQNPGESAVGTRLRVSRDIIESMSRCSSVILLD